ncbi:MAG: GntR family transcriptional regulator [Rhodococcus sp. (in: high G+C Gram-positive bacteria)]
MPELDDAIFDLILSGTYAPGEKLNETELAARFGVSRTPVREALKSLASTGVVSVEKNKGARVTEYSRESVAAMYSARSLLEPYAARLATPFFVGDALERLRGLAEEMHAQVLDARNAVEIAATNNAFHEAVLSKCPNAKVVEMVMGMFKPIVVSRNFRDYTREELLRSAMHHLEIVDAMSHQDPDWVEAIMRAHIRHGYNRAIAQ